MVVLNDKITATHRIRQYEDSSTLCVALSVEKSSTVSDMLKKHSNDGHIDSFFQLVEDLSSGCKFNCFNWIVL